MDARDGDPGLEGPDYMALVIEWNDDEVTSVESEWLSDSDLTEEVSPGRKIATVLGALVALALATWGLRRLRAAA